MIPQGFDDTVSTVLAISSAAVGLWAHRRAIEKEKLNITQQAKQKYAERQIKEYAAARDFHHIRNDLAQLKGKFSLFLPF